jgi:single-stranded DNA-binding protein
VFRLLDHDDRQLTLVTTAKGSRLFGRVHVTYLAAERPGGSRIVVAFTVGADRRWQRWRRAALAWGDLVMVRKQLRTLKEYAETTARR